LRKLSKNKSFRVAALVVFDLLITVESLFLSLAIRFKVENSLIPQLYFDNMLQLIPVLCIVVVAVFSLLNIYNSLWEYASLREAIQLGFACSIVSIISYTITGMVVKPLPRSCFFLFFMLLAMQTLSVRLVYRLMRLCSVYRKRGAKLNVMIIGAGSAGKTLIDEIKFDKNLKDTRVVCVIDDAVSKQGKYFCGVCVVGGREYLLQAVNDYEVNEIIFAIPSASMKVRKDYLEICKQTPCTLKTVPGIYQLVNGEVSLNAVRPVDIADLLGRDPISLDLDGIGSDLSEKTVLVTGAGGSIGSELCRQIAQFEPRELVMLDIYENSVFDIQNELITKYPHVKTIVLIASVRDTDRIKYIFQKYKPQLVYHAAAHKHVPLMEDSPNEAVKNNVFGTLNLVRFANQYKAERFVLISTDKAVNPTNIMGASKRICEIMIQSFNEISATEFVAVRFGNVLGSNGSVIPTFKRQIERGGPVTVTDPNIIRYFMTIPEAVSLVLQAGCHAQGGEIFVLDMGEPVKILTLAENMIRLSGFTPYQDIPIVFTGLRPGEKLYEELLMAEEGLSKTEHEMIYIARPIEIDSTLFFQQLNKLERLAHNEHSDIRAAVSEIVDTYCYDTAVLS